MGGMGDKDKYSSPPGMGGGPPTGGLPWAGANNYGYGNLPPPTHQSPGMMDRKGEYLQDFFGASPFEAALESASARGKICLNC